MNLAPLPDMGWAPIMMVLGLMGMLISFPAIVIIEAAVFKNMLWSDSTYSNAILLSLFANVVSAGIGYLLGLTGIFSGYWGFALGIIERRTGADYYNAPPIAGLALWIAMILGFWFLSILIEGALLVFIEWWLEPFYSSRKVWWASLVANTASYAMLIVIAILWIYELPE